MIQPSTRRWPFSPKAHFKRVAYTFVVVACLTPSVLLAASHFVPSDREWQFEATRRYLMLACGDLRIGIQQPLASAWTLPAVYHGTPLSQVALNVEPHASSSASNLVMLTVWLRLWPLALLGGVLMLPAIWLRRRSLMTAALPGDCCTCGYDLRATPDRCPECGRLSASPLA